MTWLQALAVMGAGLAAGAVNAVIGSGSLITFPTLLAVGYTPIVANVSNNIGLEFLTVEYYRLVRGDLGAERNDEGRETDLFAGVGGH